jgi:hypothetical protein
VSIADPYEGIEFPSVPFKADDETVLDTFIEIELTDVHQIETERDGKKRAGIVLEGEDDDGVVRDWVAWNIHNKQQVREANAQLGDRVRITYEGRDMGAKNPAFAARWFKVEVIGRD